MSFLPISLRKQKQPETISCICPWPAPVPVHSVTTDHGSQTLLDVGITCSACEDRLPGPNLRASESGELEKGPRILISSNSQRWSRCLGLCLESHSLQEVMWLQSYLRSTPPLVYLIPSPPTQGCCSSNFPLSFLPHHLSLLHWVTLLINKHVVISRILIKRIPLDLDLLFSVHSTSVLPLTAKESSLLPDATSSPLFFSHQPWPLPLPQHVLVKATHDTHTVQSYAQFLGLILFTASSGFDIADH